MGAQDKLSFCQLFLRLKSSSNQTVLMPKRERKTKKLRPFLESKKLKKSRTRGWPNQRTMSSFSFMGITKVGEGSEMKENEVPLEMNFSKGLEWLIDRNVISRTWSTQANQCKKENGGKDYLCLLREYEALLKTQDNSTGLLGGYKDTKLQQAYESVSKLKRGNVHLGNGTKFFFPFFFFSFILR